MHAHVQTNEQSIGGSLRFNGIGKTFPGVKALDGISFVAHQGVNLPRMGDETDAVQRLHTGKGFADPVEAQAAANVLFMCLYVRVHKPTSLHLSLIHI